MKKNQPKLKYQKIDNDKDCFLANPVHEKYVDNDFDIIMFLTINEKLKPQSDVRVLYSHVAVLRIEEPELVMLYGCLFRFQGNTRFKLSGQAEVSVTHKSRWIRFLRFLGL